MAVIRDHLASQGLGLFNDLQNEHSVVGNFPIIVMLRDFGTPAQKQQFITGQLNFSTRITFGLTTEPNHGSDATHMETKAVRESRHGIDGWLIRGEKMWTTGTHTTATARCSPHLGQSRRRRGITCFLVPTDTPGVKVEEYLWTFNMPTDHPRVSFTDVWVPADAMFGDEGRAWPGAELSCTRTASARPPAALGAGPSACREREVRA